MAALVMRIVAGIDLGGTAINYTLLTDEDRFLIDGLCEYPARAQEGPERCLVQIEDGLAMALDRAHLSLADIAAIGLDTPGPASATGVLSAGGSTNFVHPEWAGFDLPGTLTTRLGKPVTYLNDGNAGALWGHAAIFGARRGATSISAIIGTGLGGGVIVDGDVVKGKNGYGGELGHVLIPYQSLPGISGLAPACNCGRTGDLESLCSLTAITKSLLPWFLSKNPDHELARLGDVRRAARLVRERAAAGDPLCQDIFRVQAQALGLFFDIMINTFDPDALIVGGGAVETTEAFQRWFIGEIRAGMPTPWPEQIGIPIYVMPDGDTAGARGSAIEALKFLRLTGA
jgi:predicted NBD/HSP70 family sugar kinase